MKYHNIQEAKREELNAVNRLLASLVKYSQDDVIALAHLDRMQDDALDLYIRMENLIEKGIVL